MTDIAQDFMIQAEEVRMALEVVILVAAGPMVAGLPTQALMVMILLLIVVVRIQVAAIRALPVVRVVQVVAEEIKNLIFIKLVPTNWQNFHLQLQTYSTLNEYSFYLV